MAQAARIQPPGTDPKSFSTQALALRWLSLKSGRTRRWATGSL